MHACRIERGSATATHINSTSKIVDNQWTGQIARTMIGDDDIEGTITSRRTFGRPGFLYANFRLIDLYWLRGQYCYGAITVIAIVAIARHIHV